MGLERALSKMMARGCYAEQVFGVDVFTIYVLVVKSVPVRLLLAIAVSWTCKYINQMSQKNAFCYANIESNVYIAHTPLSIEPGLLSLYTIHRVFLPVSCILYERMCLSILPSMLMILLSLRVQTWKTWMILSGHFVRHEIDWYGWVLSECACDTH